MAWSWSSATGWKCTQVAKLFSFRHWYWITNCQRINFLEPYTHQEINTDPVDLDKFRFVQSLDIANICHDRNHQRLCTFFWAFAQRTRNVGLLWHFWETEAETETERETETEEWSGQHSQFLRCFYNKLLQRGHIETLYQKLLHPGRTRSQPTTSTERSMVCLISNSTTSSMLSHRFVFFGVKNISFSVNTNSDANPFSRTSHIHLISYTTHSNSKIVMYYVTILTRWHHFLFFVSLNSFTLS